MGIVSAIAGKRREKFEGIEEDDWKVRESRKSGKVRIVYGKVRENMGKVAKILRNCVKIWKIVVS